jgi:hypothetical protein
MRFGTNPRVKPDHELAMRPLCFHLSGLVNFEDEILFKGERVVTS